MRGGLEWFRALVVVVTFLLLAEGNEVEGRDGGERSKLVDSARLAVWAATEPRKGTSALVLPVGRAPNKPGSWGLAAGLFWFGPTEEGETPLVISALRD